MFKLLSNHITNGTFVTEGESALIANKDVLFETGLILTFLEI